MRTRGLLAVALVAWLGGCATPEPPPPPVAIPAPPPVLPPPPAPEPVPEPKKFRNDPLKHLAHRTLKPQETRPLNAQTRCSFRDPTGYRGRLQLDVKEASVKRFEANIDVPKQGSCRFQLADFHQTDTLPIVVLSARRGDCKVRLWEQEDQVTVAFRDCRKECSGNSLDYLWPILVNRQKGSCA